MYLFRTMSSKKRNIVNPVTSVVSGNHQATDETNVINGIKLSSTVKSHLDEPDAGKIITVLANDGKTGEAIELSYSNNKVIGNGSFGVVFQAKLIPSGEYSAIKKVLQDKRFKVISLIKHRIVSFKS